MRRALAVAALTLAGLAPLAGRAVAVVLLEACFLAAAGAVGTAHGETFAARQDRVLDWVNGDWPNVGQYGGPHRIGRTGFWYVEGRLERGQTNSATWTILADAIRNADGLEDANGANGGFSAWPGMDCYLRCRHLLPQSLKEQYYTEYTTMPCYDHGATPNQQFMWATACYLACETWGKENVTRYSGITWSHSDGDLSGQRWLLYQLDRIRDTGYNEHNASTYLYATLGPVRTLMEFATNTQIRAMAALAWEYGVANAAPAWLNGQWALTDQRGGIATDQTHYPGITDKEWWLLFGSPTPYWMIDTEQGVPYALSAFEGVRPEVASAATTRTGAYTYRSYGGGTRARYMQTFMQPGYALFSQGEGKAGTYADGTYNFLYPQTTGGEYQASRWGLVWDDAPVCGPSSLYLQCPTVYNGSVGGITPYEFNLQHEGAYISVLDVPAEAEQYVRVRIPTTYSAVIDETATTGRLFLHYSNVLVALYVSKPWTWQTYSFPCDKLAQACETARPDEYPQATAADRLAAFRADLLAHGGVDASRVGETPNRFIYTTRFGDTLDLTYGQVGLVNGEPMDYACWPMNESPQVEFWQQENCFIRGVDRDIVLDFGTYTVITNNRPAVTTSAAVAASGTNTVDVDLAVRVADAETPGSNLYFEVSAPVNGTVALLADGRTARFTPVGATGSGGSFAFTARDCAWEARRVLHYDFEQLDLLGADQVRDASGNLRAAALARVGYASAEGDADAPPIRSAQALRLTGSAAGGCRLTRTVTPATLNMANKDWTVAAWFNRTRYEDHDFIFYMGGGDGFGGSGDELHLYCAANAANVALRHYNASNAMDVNLTSPATATTGLWHHVAVSFERAAHNTGHVRLYLDGALSGVASNVTWSLPQAKPLVFGGHAGSGALDRFFSGLLDDVALYRQRLSDDEIRLLTRCCAMHAGGSAVTGVVSVAFAPAAPAGLQATPGNASVDLSWDPTPGAETYVVRRALAAGGPFADIAAGLAAARYTDLAVTNGVTYFYVAAARNAVGVGGNSAGASATPSATDVSIWSSGLTDEWSYGARLSFPGYDRPEALTNFPVLVALGTNVPGFAYSQLASGQGADLRFTDGAGSQTLHYEIDTWDTNGLSAVWVQVPSLTTTSSICAFWGNAAAGALDPDAVSGLQLWLKADAIAGLSDGQAVTTWPDASGNGRHATVATGTPVYKTGIVNGKPVVRFTADGLSGFAFPSMSTIRTVFWVVQETSAASLHTLLGDDNNSHFRRGDGGQPWHPTYSSSYLRGGTTRLMGSVINGTTEALGSGFRLLSVVTSGNVEASRLTTDRTYNRSWDGDIAEVLVYDRALTAEEESRVGLYLARKYGLSTAYAPLAAPGAAPDATWSGGYLGVWHLRETSGAHLDSSPALASSRSVSATQQGTAAGIVGAGDRFASAASDYVSLPDMGTRPAVTVECWVSLTANPGGADIGLVSSDPYTAGCTHFKTSSTRQLKVAINSGGGYVSAANMLELGQWAYAAYTVAGSGADDLKLYRNGTLLGSAAGRSDNNLADVNIAREYNGRYLDAKVDEVRVSAVARSADWLWASWRSVASNRLFNSYWSVVPNPSRVPSLPAVRTDPASGISATGATLNGTLQATGTAPTRVWAYWGPADGAAVKAAWSNSVDLGVRGAGPLATTLTGLSSGAAYFCRFYASNTLGGAWASASVNWTTRTAAPAGLAASSGNGRVNLQWTDAPGAVRYAVKRATAAEGPYATLISDLAGTSYADLAVTNGVRYFYAVSSFTAGGESATNSAAANAMPLAPPATLTAFGADAAARLSWSAAPGAAGYRVRRSPTTGGPYALVADASGTAYTNSGLANGSFYYYVVAATNGADESANSAEAWAVPAATPPTPTGLWATPGNASVRLGWSAPLGALSHNVKRSLTAGGPYSTVAAALLGTAWTDTGVANGTPYYYAVSANTFGGEGPLSAEASATPFVPPKAYTNATAGAWNAVTWLPDPPGQPYAAADTTLVFNNAPAITSDQNLGPFVLNALKLTGQGVALAGDPLVFSGTAPQLAATQNAAHTIANALYLDAAASVSVATGTLALDGPVSGGGGVSKLGGGTLRFSSADGYGGDTLIDAGTVVFAADHAPEDGDLIFGLTDGSASTASLDLSAASFTASSLTVRNNHATANTVTLGAGKTLAVSGPVVLGGDSDAATTGLRVTGGGTLAVSGDLNVARDPTTGATLDLAGLGSFVFDNPGGTFGVATPDDSKGTVILARNNAITANLIDLGHGAGQDCTGVLRLGATNTVAADAVYVGTFKASNCKIEFAASGSRLVLSGVSEDRTDLYVGYNPNTGASNIGVTGCALNWNNSTVEALIGVLEVGYNDLAVGQGQGTVNFNQGALDILSARVGYKKGASGGDAVGTLNIGGGAVKLGSLVLAGSAAGDVSVGTLNITGGAVTLDGDITTSASGTSTLALSGGTLDLGGHDVGAPGDALDAFTFSGGLLANPGTVAGALALGGTGAREIAQNVGTGRLDGVVSGPGVGLLKSGTNSLTLAAVNTYGGDTLVAAGTLVVGPAGRLGTGKNFAVAAGATGELQNAGGSLNSATTVRLDGVLRLPAGVTNAAACLVIGGVVQAEGLWNAARDPAHFAGGGALLVAAAPFVLLDSDAYGETSFNAAGNWSGAAAPAAGNAYFSGPYTLRTPHDSASSWAFAGQSLTLDAGGTLMYKGASGYAITVDPLILNGGTLFNGVNGATWSLLGTACLAQPSSFSFGQDNAVTVLAADLAGPGRLATAGARPTEALTLSGNNAAWSGGLTFNGGGSLNLNSAAALGSGTFIITAANGSAALDNTSAADLTLSAAPPQAWNGDFTFTGTRSLNLGTNAVTLGGDRVVTVAAGSLTVGGGLGDGASAFGLTKAGAGTLVLAGDGSYDGPTAVTAGELAIAAPAALGSAAGATAVADGARVVLADGVTVSGEPIALAGYGGNARGALQAGPGASATWDGPVLLNSGDTRVGAQAGGTLTISGNIADGTATHFLASADAATGRVILSGPANAYSGETRIGRGTLLLGRDGALPAGTVLNVHSFTVADAAAFDLNGFSQTVAGLRRGNTAGPASVNNSSPVPATLTVANAAAFTFDSPVSGNLALTKSGAGTLTLSAANTYAGPTTVSAGTLAAAPAGSFGAGHLSVSNGATAALANPAGAVADAAYVHLSGSGRLVLSNGVDEAVERLYIDGAPQPAGTWNAARDAAHFAGAGNLLVATGSLPPPTGLAATGRDLHIELAWDAVAGATGYVVKRATTSGGPYTALGSPDGPAFSDTAVAGGTTYYYVVATVNALGEGWASQEASASILVDLRAWTHTMTVSFPGYTRSEPLTNFPALLVLRPTIPEFAYTQFAAAEGGDLRFTDAGQTRLLNYEVERWDASGASYVWVQVPALAAGATIRAYWGNPSAAAPACRSDGSVWSNGYRGVWHLEQAAADASAGGHDAALHTAAAADGIVAGAASYDGVSSESRVPHHADFDLAANFEIQGWFRLAPGDAADYRVLTAKELPGNYNNRNWWIALRGDGRLWWKSSSAIDALSAVSYADNAWHHFAAVHDGAAARLYVDGLPAAVDSTPGTASVQDAPVTLGAEDGAGRYHKGGLDDVRVSGVARSSNWVWTCWAIVASNAAFTASGPAEATVPASYTNAASGAWGAVTWQPDPPGRPPSLSSTALVFANAGPVASTNDLGAFRLNSLLLDGAAATLSGGALVFDGAAPRLSASQPVVHTVSADIVLGATLRVALAAGETVLAGAVTGAGGLHKEGAGTLVLTGANAYAGTTTVEAGALRLGASGTLNTGQRVVLAGGMLDMGAFDNALGTLDVTAPSRLALGSGTLSFADSSARDWTGALTLTGALGRRTVRFGDSADALTAEQLLKITVNGMPAHIGADGYLQISRGAILLVQ